MLERFKRIWSVWKGVGERMVHLQNALLLLIVFVFGLLPAAVIVRLGRKRLLDRGGPNAETDSYWTPSKAVDRDMDWAQRPF
jgi:hypothetical protein